MDEGSSNNGTEQAHAKDNPQTFLAIGSWKRGVKD